MQKIVFSHKGCLLFLLLFCMVVCRSQSYQYQFSIINLPENFKNQYISLVDEDAAGMLWFVTNNGLHRYDGNQVLTFDMQSAPALPDVNIRLLFADSRHQLWLATRNELVRFDLQQWAIRVIPFQQAPAALQDYAVTAIAEGQDGTLYAGCGNANLYRIVNDSLQLIAHINRPATDTLNNYAAINTIQEPVKGNVWLTTSKGQIVLLRHQGARFAPPVAYEPPQLANSSVNFLLVSPSGKCLVDVPGKGPFLVDTAQAVATPLTGPAGLPSLQSKNVYVAGFEGSRASFFNKSNDADEPGLVVYDVENNTFENLTNVYPTAFKSNMLRGVRYKNGHVLIPNKGGIATVSHAGGGFDVFTSSLENTNSIRTLYKVPGGPLLIGSYLHRFVRFDEASSYSTSSSDNLVSCLLPWHADTLLAGMEGGVLSWYLPQTNRFIPLFGSGAANPINPYVHCLCRENDTSFWAGTSTGFYLVNPYTRRIVKSSLQEGYRQLQQSVVYDVLKVGRYRFFATQEGLFKYDMQSKTLVKQLRTAASTYTNSCFSCLRLVGSQVWAGTLGNGILVLDTAGNLLRKITTADGLAGNIVFSNPLCKNHILAGTGTGLSIINTQSGKISNYSSQYYLPANEFNRSAWCVNGDTVYLGTINGFIRIDMNRLRQQQAEAAPGICFSSFTFSNSTSSQSDYTLPYRNRLSLTIPPDANYFSIGIGGLSEMGNGLKLYYRLSADGPWQDIGQLREITFVNIAPDNYAMQIAARLPDGRWMENVLSLPIHVRPRYYQTGWFKTLLFAVAVALIWLGIKYRERNLKKEQQLRNRIAGDLHDEVGSALTRIYFQAGMLSADSGTAIGRLSTALQKIAASSQEALSSMSDMVWSIDAHYDNTSDMLGRMKDYIARLQEDTDSNCSFEVTGSYEKKHLTQVTRQNIFLIFKEAINNAVKYGDNKKVQVRLSFTEDPMLLTVENTFLPLTITASNHRQGGHGLQSMQLRAQKIRGQLQVEKEGSKFIVRLKVKV